MIEPPRPPTEPSVIGMIGYFLAVMFSGMLGGLARLLQSHYKPRREVTRFAVAYHLILGAVASLALGFVSYHMYGASLLLLGMSIGSGYTAGLVLTRIGQRAAGGLIDEEDEE